MTNILEGKFTHFTQKELENGKDIPDELYPNIIPTALILDALRTSYGKPIYINSTYRSPSHNRGIGGKTKSLHLDFNAIDFSVENKKDLPMLYQTLCEWDSTENLFLFLPKLTGNMGLGLYPTFIHIDTRATLGRKAPARWQG